MNRCVILEMTMRNIAGIIKSMQGNMPYPNYGLGIEKKKESISISSPYPIYFVLYFVM
jgi:hypothetical protein